MSVPPGCSRNKTPADYIWDKVPKIIKASHITEALVIVGVEYSFRFRINLRQSGTERNTHYTSAGLNPSPGSRAINRKHGVIWQLVQNSPIVHRTISEARPVPIKERKAIPSNPGFRHMPITYQAAPRPAVSHARPPRQTHPTASGPYWLTARSQLSGRCGCEVNVIPILIKSECRAIQIEYLDPRYSRP